jgi:hypothetical protein
MGSSQLKIENRTSLYFSKYKYRAQCRVMGACYTYYTSSLEQFKKKLEATRVNRNQYRISIMNNRFEETYDVIDFDQIAKFFKWKNNKDLEKFMYRIQGNQISFFSNDLELLKTLSDIDPDLKLSMADVKVTDKMFFKKEPKYKYRTYFKGRRYPDNFYEHVNDLISMYKDNIKFSPGMVRMINKYSNSKYRYMHTSYYIDYNDPSMLTIFGLWFGEFLAKTYSLEKQP